MADTDPKSKPSDKAPKLAVASEEGMYATLGALLGTLEVIAADEHHPLDKVQVERLRSAGRLGRRLHHYLEAALILTDDDLGERMRRVRTSLRPLVEHALRGAIRSCEAYAVKQQVVEADAWSEVKVVVDASRVDRALGALIEALAVQVGYGGTIVVSIHPSPEQVVLSLHGQRATSMRVAPPALGFGEDVSLFSSSLLCRAWTRLFALHGGQLLVDSDGPSARVSLPMTEAT